MPRYIMKKGVGPHKFRGGWLRPGDAVECEEDELAGALAKFDLETPATPSPKIKDDAPTDPPRRRRGAHPPAKDTDDETEDAEPAEDRNGQPGLVLSHRGGGRYDVVNPGSGQKINDEYLTKAEAQDMLRKNS